MSNKKTKKMTARPAAKSINQKLNSSKRRKMLGKPPVEEEVVDLNLEEAVNKEAEKEEVKEEVKEEKLPENQPEEASKGKVSRKTFGVRVRSDLVSDFNKLHHRENPEGKKIISKGELLEEAIRLLFEKRNFK